MSARLLLAAALLLAGWLLFVPTARVPLHYDMLGYSSQALSLAEGQGNTVPVGGQAVPGIYPAGLPALGAVALAVLGPDMRHAQVAVFVCALLALLITAALAARAGGPWAGLTAALLLLSCTAFRGTARFTLSQVPTALAVALAALLWVRAKNGRDLAIAGFVAGLSVLLRYANVCFPAGLLAAQLLVRPLPGTRRLRSLLWLGAGLALAAGLVLLHNAVIYGSPRATGYEVWGWDVSGQFSPHNFFATQGDRAPGAEGDWVLLRALLGLGTLQSVAVTLLAVAGVVVLWRRRDDSPGARRLLAIAVTGVGAQYVFLGGYAFRSETYLVPTLPLVCAVGAVAARDLLAWRLGERVARWAPLLGALALGADLLKPPVPDEATVNALVRHDSLVAASAVLEPDAVLLTTSDPALVEPLLGNDGGRRFVYLGPYVSPVVERVGLAALAAPRSSPYAVTACAKREVAAGRAVYLDQNPPPRGAAPVHKLVRDALLEAFRLVPTPAPNVFRLVPRVSDPSGK